MATFEYSRLEEITTIGAAAASHLANGSGEITYVRSIILHNTHTTAEEVTLWNVPDSGGSLGTAADANQFFKETLMPDETVVLEFPAPGIILEDTNDSIQAAADDAAEVTIQIYGGKDS